jgi:hypothetical protein
MKTCSKNKKFPIGKIYKMQKACNYFPRSGEIVTGFSVYVRDIGENVFEREG